MPQIGDIFSIEHSRSLKKLLETNTFGELDILKTKMLDIITIFQNLSPIVVH